MIDNIISVSFSDEDIEKMNSAIALLNEALEGKAVNLTPEERRQYGSIADRNKILVDKAKFYMEKAPQTMPRTIDKAEFDRDYAARTLLEAPLRELTIVTEKLRDTKTLLDFDNLQSTLAYYRYVKYLASENEPGTTSIYQDMKQHYQRGGAPQPEEPETPAPEPATS